MPLSSYIVLIKNAAVPETNQFRALRKTASTLEHQILVGRLMAFFLDHQGRIWLALRQTSKKQIKSAIKTLDLNDGVMVDIIPLAHHVIVNTGFQVPEQLQN